MGALVGLTVGNSVGDDVGSIEQNPHVDAQSRVILAIVSGLVELHDEKMVSHHCTKSTHVGLLVGTDDRLSVGLADGFLVG